MRRMSASCASAPRCHSSKGSWPNLRVSASRPSSSSQALSSFSSCLRSRTLLRAVLATASRRVPARLCAWREENEMESRLVVFARCWPCLWGALFGRASKLLEAGRLACCGGLPLPRRFVSLLGLAGQLAHARGERLRSCDCSGLFIEDVVERVLPFLQKLLAVLLALLSPGALVATLMLLATWAVRMCYA